MMVAIAVVALGLFIAQEFQDGLPPRFVVRGIPGRINRLRPGMTWEQTHEVLGLEKTWLLGGMSARLSMEEGNGHYQHEFYYVQLPRAVVRTLQVGGGAPRPVTVMQSRARIELWLRTDYGSPRNWRQDLSTQLVRASFSSDFATIAENPAKVEAK
jgi:hypothetical protein